MPRLLGDTRAQTEQPSLFRLSGGFSLSTRTIGCMMAVQGVYAMLAQLWLFPYIVQRLGPLTAFHSVMAVWPLLYISVPYLLVLPKCLETAGIFCALFCKMTFQTISFPSSAILLNRAPASLSQLGRINGIAASTACLARALGPVTAGHLYGEGANVGYGVIAWWTIGLVAAIGSLVSVIIVRDQGVQDAK